ncbi:hypothetical protein J7643_10055 [bacterium]|nr:hypothetical protein [bacterium]
MKAHSILVLVGAALVASCATTTAPSVANGQARVSLLASLQAGSFRAQSTVVPYTPADVQHLRLDVFKLVQGSEVAVVDAERNLPMTLDIASGSLGKAIELSGLNLDTTYRIRGYAYDAPGTAHLISKDALVDVRVTHDDRPEFATLPVRLIDKVFNGEASSDIAISSGSVTYTGSESITLSN